MISCARCTSRSCKTTPIEIWVNGLLSALGTHAVNASSNFARQACDIAEKGVAVPIDIARSKITGKPRQIYAPAVFADMSSGWSVLKKGAAEFIKGIRDETYGMYDVSFDRPTMVIPGKLGVFFRGPGRWLKAMDVFWKAAAMERELSFGAMNKAMSEGLRGEKAGARAHQIRTELAEGKHMEIFRAAKASSEKETFTNRLEGNLAVFQRLRDVEGMRWIVPFMMTPINIILEGLRRTPAGFIMGRGPDNPEIARTMAAATLGTGIGVAVFEAVRNGVMTGGGPADFVERQNWEKQGNSHTGMVCMRVLHCLLWLALQTGSIAAGPEADQKGVSRSAANSAPAPRTFSTSFVSLSPGHDISTSLFVFRDGDTFEIQIPGVDCREPAGAYTRNGLMFVADFSATVLKQKKHYRYAFSAKGISLFDSYIAGTMVLDERIKETGQEQKVTFVFWGTSEAAGTDEEKNLFPF